MLEITANNVLDLLQKFAESIPLPVVICNEVRDIVSYNARAGSFLPLSNGNGVGNVVELVPGQEQNRFMQILSDSAKSRGTLHEYINIKTADDRIVKIELTVKELIRQHDEIYFILTFNPSFRESVNAVPEMVSIRTDKLDTVIRNKRILQVVDEIKSNFPFTFIGRNKIQQEINKFEELFWLKDVNDSYLIVNKKFSESLGLKPQQLEGRPEKNYLPLYFLDFHRTLENYVKDTLNALILEGIPFRGFSSWLDYQSIEIPLCDSDNNVLAFIGISQRKAYRQGDAAERSGVTSDNQMIERLPQYVAVFNREEELINASKTFMRLFPGVAQKNAHLSEFFDENSYQQFHQFLAGDQKAVRFEIELSLKKGESSLFSLEILKNTASGSEWSDFLLSLEKLLSYDSIEDLIKQKGAMFDTLIQYNPEPIFIYDAENLRFLEVNDAALQLYGYKREEFLQMDLTDLYSPEDIQSLLDSAPSKEKVPVFQGPFKHRRKDGKSVLVQIAKTGFVYENREAHFNIVKNISEEVSKSADTEVFRSVYQNTSDIVVITDSTGFIQEVNSAAFERLGYDRSRLINSSIVEYLNDDDRGELNSSVYFSGDEDTVQLQLHFNKKDGEVLLCNVKAIPIKGVEDRIETYNLVISPEVSPREIIKEVIKEVEVEKKVEVVREVEVIKEVEKVKEVFVDRPTMGSHTSQGHSKGIDVSQISTIFHEILTPINVILGFVQELKDSIGRPNTEQSEAIEYINQNRDNLLDIMNSISEFAQIRGAFDELVPEEVAVVEIVEEVIADEQDFLRAAEKEIAFGKLSASLLVYSDKSRLKMLIDLLTKICLKITDEKQVYVSAQQYDDVHYMISIRDNFSKISDKLFNNFEAFLKGKSQISPKNFQLSRYSFSSVNELLELFKGDFEVVLRSGKPYELGFKIPINIFEERSESQEAEAGQYDDIPPTIHVELQPIPAGSAKSVPNIRQNEEQQRFQEPVYSSKHAFAEESFSDMAIPEPKYSSKTPVQSEPQKKVNQPVYHDMEDDIAIPVNAKFSFQSPVIEQESFVKQGEAQNKANEFENISAPPAAAKEREVEITPPASLIEPAAAAPKAIEKDLRLGNLNCLYIEDQVDSQILFKVQMKELREIKFAVSFEEALPLLSMYQFDFIVMDINLQGEYNGLDALKMIHQMPQFAHIPIIAVTAYVLPGDKEKFILAGFNDFISKPIFREKIIESLEKIFRKKIGT